MFLLTLYTTCEFVPVNVAPQSVPSVQMTFTLVPTAGSPASGSWFWNIITQLFIYIYRCRISSLYSKCQQHIQHLKKRYTSGVPNTCSSNYTKELFIRRPMLKYSGTLLSYVVSSKKGLIYLAYVCACVHKHADVCVCVFTSFMDQHTWISSG